MTLNNIDINSREGRLLMAALCILTTSPELTIDGKKVDGRKLNPNDLLNQLVDFGEWMYGDYYVK
jgi:hypothetical protein